MWFLGQSTVPYKPLALVHLLKYYPDQQQQQKCRFLGPTKAVNRVAPSSPLAGIAAYWGVRTLAVTEQRVCYLDVLHYHGLPTHRAHPFLLLSPAQSWSSAHSLIAPFPESLSVSSSSVPLAFIQHFLYAGPQHWRWLTVISICRSLGVKKRLMMA